MHCMNWINRTRPTANGFLLYFCTAWKVATAVGVSMLFLTGTQAWFQPVPGSLDVHWNEGASDCTATPQNPLQIHTYEPQTFILRQNPCVNFEANVLYLLVGSDKALLIDTGAVADSKEMPLAKTILELLPDKDHKRFHFWWRIPTAISIAPAILSSRRFHRSRSCPQIWREFERSSVSLTGPTGLHMWIWAAELWM